MKPISPHQKPESDSIQRNSSDLPFQKALQSLKKRAAEIITSETEADWLPLMRNAAGHLDIDLDVRDSDFRAFLSEAYALIAPEGVGKKTGEKLDLTPIPWAWDGIIMRNRMNLLVAQPKVGKTALLLEMISKWYQNRTSFLGREFKGKCPSVIIVGTDQGEADWASMLRLVGLIGEDGTILDPIKRIWTAANPLHFNEKGFKTLEDELEQHEDCLVLVDSYHACVSPLGIEDSGSTYANALAALLISTAKFHATCCVVHHANKGSGSDVVSSSRGTTALTAIPSQLIHMGFMRSDNQRDRRINLKTQGRAGNPINMLIEREDNGWIFHGDGEAAEAAERLQELSNDLSGRQADFYDYIESRWEIGKFTVAPTELGREFNLTSNKVTRYLRQLESKGLIEQCGQTDPGSEGGRPSMLYRPISPSLETGCERCETCETPPYTREIEGLSPISPSKPGLGRGGLSPLSKSAPVERLLPSGTWESGWLIRDGMNPHAITIEKIGNPLLLIRNLRWEIDLRAATTAFPANQVSTTSEAPEWATQAISAGSGLVDSTGDDEYVF